MRVARFETVRTLRVLMFAVVAKRFVVSEDRLETERTFKVPTLARVV